MRTYDERVEELHLRMKERQNTKAIRRARMISTAAYGACALIAALLAVMISAVRIEAPGAMGSGTAASVFADHAALGYVVVALLAFCLGALVTVLCHRLNVKRREEEGHDD